MNSTPGTTVADESCGHQSLRSVVTIDGPAGAGKTTVARRLAERLGWRLLDTGAMYRAVTLAAIRSETDLSSDDALARLVDRIQVEQNEDGSILLNGEDVSSEIRGTEVTRASKFVADSPSVRGRLVDWQREFVSRQNTVTEGRDQGTIVFPDALGKFFLTATDEERARRRHAELLKRGQTIEFEQVLNDQRERDARDSCRQIAPMKPAHDAIVFDTTGLSLEEVVNRLQIEVDRRLRLHHAELPLRSPSEVASHG